MTQATLLKMDIPEQTTTSHTVLARKYRPRQFADVIGQDVLVKVLRHGLETNRLPHAFILTGIRGVGKTTTARILARALNCRERENSNNVEPCGKCDQCTSILEDRNIDVIEMDAASRTGVEDVREIIDAAKYRPVSAAYKVYIIDEVHMLSKSAFNALLKTLEEPPEHVKFVFATTEIQKVPKTVLSRCMRFDLSRVSVELLKKHFSSLAEKENFTVDDIALTQLARAADGSVRDGLSMLDQAVALSNGAVTSEIVSDMLGLADADRVINLLRDAIMGEGRATIAAVQALYDLGADPLNIINELLNLTYTLTTIKVDSKLIANSGYGEDQQKLCLEMAEQMTVPTLNRVWQILMNGANEVQMANSPNQACQMVALRLVHCSTMPSPEEVIKAVQSGEAAPVIQITPKMETVENYDSFAAIVELANKHREPLLYAYLKSEAHLVHFEPGHITIRLSERAPADLAVKLPKLLKKWTKQDWIIDISKEEGMPSLLNQEKSAYEELIESAKKSPMVAKTLESFPGAEIESITDTN